MPCQAKRGADTDKSSRIPRLLLSLTRHLGVLGRRLKVVIVLVVLVVGGVLGGGLGKVDFGTAGSAAALDNVVQVDLVGAVLNVVCQDVLVVLACLPVLFAA